MARQPIKTGDLELPPFGQWEPGWFLLTAGDFAAGAYNTMTVSWGTLGILWGKPLAQCYVRPQRHTRQFIDQYPTWTLCAFAEAQRPALNLLGSLSGRDGDKIAKAGLTPEASQVVAAPSFAEAELVIECRTLYTTDLDPARFVDPSIHEVYPSKDYHRCYFGEVVAVSGTAAYR